MRSFARFLTLSLFLATSPVAAQVIEANVPGRATPPAITDKENQWLLDLSDGGRVTIWLRPDVAPKMVERIKTLTRQHFYDGLAFHRVIDGFMAQGGDPKGDGTGGSTLPNVASEFNYLPHVRGAVAAARADDPNSANSQFFIVFQPRLSLDKKYTVFGRVIDGMQYVDAIERGEPPSDPTKIVHAYIAADNPPPYANMPAPAPVTLGAPVTLPGAGKGTPRPAGKAAPKKVAPQAK
ncbi:peptidylprolyl isomerase [Sphingomonas sp. MA1305]|uniref:peptidylprolyl isomerase n=1 Tax=unclassified Sphingomonas TaxID=196159 RepID=UPI0018DF613D|nr:peptidylprolyl isomerase [Sphingomonas sp. MA1305]MBI0475422.1 peptidylprolyl isomerase [Sphingomonas sp. MA1305]